MHTLTWLLWMTTVAAGASSSASPPWEKVFDGGADKWVSAIKATGRDTWVAAGGRWGLVTSTKDGTTVEPTDAHGVLGIFVESPTSVFAFGEGELIKHFDGKKWTVEHVAPMPPKGRGPFSEHMLYLAYQDSAPNAPLVALGLELVLVRQPDRTWAQPPKAEKEKLLKLGSLGPQLALPSKCAAAGWHWFGRNRGAFYCHDRRMFVWAAGTLVPKGKMPSKCYDSLDSLAEMDGELFASCNSTTLWKTEGEEWRRIEAPKEKGLKNAFVAWAGGCLFVGGDRAVWRSCGL
jgi:hypothetical protein